LYSLQLNHLQLDRTSSIGNPRRYLPEKFRERQNRHAQSYGLMGKNRFQEPKKNMKYNKTVKNFVLAFTGTMSEGDEYYGEERSICDSIASSVRLCTPPHTVS
jgi:hypothetical protein